MAPLTSPMSSSWLREPGTPSGSPYISGSMTFSFIHASSCCMNDCFCSDIYLSLSASINSFGSGQLALLATAWSQAAGCPAVSRAWQSASALGRTPCQALIRGGGGYNEKPRARLGLSLVTCSLRSGPCSGRRGVAGQRDRSPLPPTAPDGAAQKKEQASRERCLFERHQYSDGRSSVVELR